MVATVSAEKNELSRFHMGIRGSVTISDMSRTGTSLVFPSGGIAADFKIAPIPLYLETGLYYMNKGYSTARVNVSDHSLVMPLLASYHIAVRSDKKMSIQPFCGPFVSYGFNSEEVDYGVRVGCGWNFGRLYANAGYDFGLRDFKEGYCNAAFITIGFNWAGAK